MASGIDEATEKSAKIADRKNLKFNYIVNTGDGAFYAMAMGMVPLTTVITYFVSGFVSQKWLIGLLSSLNILLMCSPQILVSKKLEKLRYYKPFMIFTGLLLRLLWLLLGLDVILLANKNPRLFIILFYVIYSLIGLVAAFVGISWLNFIVKIIPDEVRGRFLGIRSTIAGVCESTGALLMGIIIKRFPYPFNYGVLFVTVFVVTMISISILSLSREHEWEKEIKEDENKSYLSKMSYVLKTDSNFANYLISVALISGLGKMAFAFQIIFAKEKLGIMDQQLSYATFILLASQSAGYLIWGILGDRRGFKPTLEISAVIFLPAILFTYMMSSLTVFYLSMALYGLAQSARNINENNLAINLCRNADEQPLYIGLRNLIMGPIFAFSPVAAGIIYDYMGYSWLFIISAFFMAVGLHVLLRQVREYRPAK